MKRILSWRVLAALMLGLALVLSACGDDDDEDSADEASASEPADDASASEPADDDASASEPADDDASASEPADDEAAAGIAVTLNDDFEILLGSDPGAGSVTFNVTNEGPDFPHALTIVRAASIEELPRNEANGAIDMDAVDAADVVGSTAIPMAAGVAEDLTVDLEAGDYVFFCPIQNETQSHVAAGQIIAVSVGG